MKFKFQSIIQYEYDSETERTKVIKAFTTPIGQTASARQRGASKLDFKGATSSDEEVVL